jgi:hypothetical protein
MSNRYRRSYLAAGRWLVVAILLATPALGQTDEPKGSGVEGEAATQESEAQTPAAAPTKKKRKSARYYETLCKSATDPKDRDLCQQWRMAEAAKKQAKWTQRQFWATIAEIGALALTVLFTGWAAIAAGRAARAATKSVEVTEDTAKRQLRAYVGTISVPVEKLSVGAPPRICINIRNFGLTPAYKLQSWIDIVHAGTESEVEQYSLPFRESLIVLYPSGKNGNLCTADFDLDRELYDHLMDGTKNIYLLGQFRYEDAFGDVRITAFRYQIGGKFLMDEMTMRISEGGNWAT